MTPRTVVFSLPETRPPPRSSSSIPRFRSRGFRSTASERDHVTGFVLKTDILLAQLEGRGESPLSELAREVRAIGAHASLEQAMDELLDQRVHLLIVLDEYGGFDGVVTLEDVVETLIGIEIVDEADTTVDMRQLARQRWRERIRTLGIDPALLDQDLASGLPRVRRRNRRTDERRIAALRARLGSRRLRFPRQRGADTTRGGNTSPRGDFDAEDRLTANPQNTGRPSSESTTWRRPSPEPAPPSCDGMHPCRKVASSDVARARGGGRTRRSWLVLARCCDRARAISAPPSCPAFGYGGSREVAAPFAGPQNERGGPMDDTVNRRVGGARMCQGGGPCNASRVAGLAG